MCSVSFQKDTIVSKKTVADKVFIFFVFHILTNNYYYVYSYNQYIFPIQSNSIHYGVQKKIIGKKNLSDYISIKFSQRFLNDLTLNKAENTAMDILSSI